MPRVRAAMFVALLFVVCLAPPTPHAAEDVALSYAVLTAQQEGPVVRGTLRVEVRNLTKGGIQNVDVRLAQPGPNSIEKGLFQLGAIPAGEARSVTGGYVFDAASPVPLLWSVDYDDASGAHHRAVLSGTQVGQ